MRQARRIRAIPSSSWRVTTRRTGAGGRHGVVGPLDRVGHGRIGDDRCPRRLAPLSTVAPLVLLPAEAPAGLVGTEHHRVVLREAGGGCGPGVGPHVVVGEGGLEPPRGCPHWHLKPARLPFRHSPEWSRNRTSGPSGAPRRNRPGRIGSGPAERAVRTEVRRGRRGVRLEPGPFVERVGDHLDERQERIEVAVGGRGERGLHQVVAGDVDGVHPVHAPRRSRRRPPVDGPVRSTTARPTRRRRRRDPRSSARAGAGSPRTARQGPEAGGPVHPLGLEQRPAGRRPARRRPAAGRRARAWPASRRPSTPGTGRRTTRSTSVAAFDRDVLVGVDQREQRLGEAGEVPLRDLRLVAVGVATAVVDRAEHGRRVVARP